MLNFPFAVNEADVNRLAGQVIVVKCGGNAMINNKIKKGLVDDLVTLKRAGIRPVVVHGGGPVIKELLKKAGVKSEFVEGHRKTDAEAMRYVEMALSGRVNGELVRLINRAGERAVGLSGKDAGMAIAQKRLETIVQNGSERQVDLGFVGDITTMDPALVKQLLEGGYLPVVSPVSSGKDGADYNVNADMFAGHLSAAIEAHVHVAITNVDGLQTDPEDSETLIREISATEARRQIGNFIRGGMIPKIESCLIAVENGVESARIINGTRPHALLKELFTQGRVGTLITESDN